MSPKAIIEPFYIEQFKGTKLPTYTKDLMPSMLSPTFCKAKEASHLRDRDCVLGVSFDGLTRAYPLWIMDNVHIANDLFHATPLAVIHCERCSSGAAYFPDVGGRRLTFQVAGIWKMTLILADDQTGSFWAHNEGISIDGPMKGTVLERYPCYQSTWEDWRRMHPETEVLLWPENELHRDGRHGHGSRDYLARPGIRAGESLGVKPELVDERLPEHLLILGIRSSSGTKAYALRDVHKNGGVVNDMLGHEPIVIWSPYLDSHLMAAFSRHLDGIGDLEFSSRGGLLVDKETGSEWSVDGIAMRGPLAGKHLLPLDWITLKWHAWSPFHPDTGLYQPENELEEGQLQTGLFQPLFLELREGGYRLQFDDRVLKAHLPNLAEAGVILRIDADRFHLYRFESNLGAEEYAYGHGHLLRAGRIILKSEPEKQYADNAQLIPLPDDEMAWSSLLSNPSFVNLLQSHAGITDSPQIGLHHLVEGLNARGYVLEWKQQLEARRLPVYALNGYEVSINGDPFLMYRFDNNHSAQAFCDWHGHSVSTNNFALRSDPPDQYRAKGLETVDVPVEEISWSTLLDSKDFLRVLTTIIG